MEDITLNDVGLTAAFECEISIAGLKPEWTKGSKVLKSDERVSIVFDGKIHRLTISEATGDDEGQYSVNFTEKNASSTAKLFVKGSPIIGILSVFWLFFSSVLINIIYNVFSVLFERVECYLVS